MVQDAKVVWNCPKDGTAMTPRGRRAAAWRCPACRGIFIDAEAMRQRRAGGPPKVARLLASAIVSLVATAVVRRLRHTHRMRSSAAVTI
jgi:Transcription factor zinc-finger